MAKGLENPFRQLVMIYVVDQAVKLLDCEEFKDMFSAPLEEKQARQICVRPKEDYPSRKKPNTLITTRFILVNVI